MHFLQKFYQNLVRNVRHCNKFAKFAILVQTCKIRARNAKLTRISEEFCKICDSCNLGYWTSIIGLSRLQRIDVGTCTVPEYTNFLVPLHEPPIYTIYSNNRGQIHDLNELAFEMSEYKSVKGMK